MKFILIGMGGVEKVGWIIFEMMFFKYGNSYENENDYYFYVIKDWKWKGIYKYGVCGRFFNKDGLFFRVNE